MVRANYAEMSSHPCKKSFESIQLKPYVGFVRNAAIGADLRDIFSRQIIFGQRNAYDRYKAKAPSLLQRGTEICEV